MKQIVLTTLIVAASCTAINAQSTVDKKQSPEVMDTIVALLRKELHMEETNQMYLEELYKIATENKRVGTDNRKTVEVPRYKMYQTENTYNLIKLDTRIGRVWQVQYRMKSVASQTVSLNYFGIVSEREGWDGRFELYPTKNMYTFIMLDTGTGDTYQVQWSTDGPSYRFVERME